MKYKTGQKVLLKIKSREYYDSSHSPYPSSIVHLNNKIVTICRVFSDSYYIEEYRHYGVFGHELAPLKIKESDL